MGNQDLERQLKHFGRRVKLLREKRKLTQAQLSYMLEVEISTISRMERGLLNTTLRMIFALSEALDVPVQELFEDTIGDDS